MGGAGSQSAEADRSSTTDEGHGEHEAGTAKILVVDDTPGNLFAFRELLGPLGHRIFEAPSGHEAMALIARHEFAVILLDVMMPGMDGFETLSRMREGVVIRSTPVIMITARDLNRAEVDRAYALGVIDFLTKPVYPEVLRGKVASCVSLHVANRELRRREAALSMKDRQIAVLAHDLRNPLNTVTAAIRLLGRLPESDQVRKEQLLLRVERGLTRMNGMIRDLLDYARAGSGAIPIVRERMDLADLARDLVDEFEIADPSRRIDLTRSGETTGSWDRTRLYQALSNLVGNATHYGHGDASIAIGGDGRHVEIAVHNSGPPISVELLSVIFEPFRRGGDGAGLGLGLYIVRAIAQAHGGDVTVTSSAEVGTTFTLRLPVEPAGDLGP
jgi:two-component system sensor histidine kinase/response regulator